MATRKYKPLIITFSLVTAVFLASCTQVYEETAYMGTTEEKTTSVPVEYYNANGEKVTTTTIVDTGLSKNNVSNIVSLSNNFISILEEATIAFDEKEDSELKYLDEILVNNDYEPFFIDFYKNDSMSVTEFVESTGKETKIQLVSLIDSFIINSNGFNYEDLDNDSKIKLYIAQVYTMKFYLDFIADNEPIKDSYSKAAAIREDNSEVVYLNEDGTNALLKFSFDNDEPMTVATENKNKFMLHLVSSLKFDKDIDANTWSINAHDFIDYVLDSSLEWLDN